MLDHPSAQTVFERLVTSAALADGEIELALSHAATCEICAEQFEVGRTAACAETEEDLPEAARTIRQGETVATWLPAVARHVEGCERCQKILAELVAEPAELPQVAEFRVVPDALFERALTGALSDADPTVRERAAERLGTVRRLGAEALAALAAAAAEDREQRVRAAALVALDQLDEQIAIPQRLIEAWSAAPSEAAPFIAGVLGRLAGQGAQAVAQLSGSSKPGQGRLTVAGRGGIKGDIAKEKQELWLTLKDLPPEFEKTKPVVAVPSALEKDTPRFKWSGDKPGLVPATSPVAKGSLRVLLGKGEPAEKEKLFRQIYLLSPESRPEERHGR